METTEMEQVRDLVQREVTSREYEGEEGKKFQ